MEGDFLKVHLRLRMAGNQDVCVIHMRAQGGFVVEGIEFLL